MLQTSSPDGAKRNPGAVYLRMGCPRITLRSIRATVLLLGLLCSGAFAQSAPPTPEQIDQGREVYDDLCSPCHGQDMVAPGAVVFDLRKFPKDDFTRFRTSVLNGKGTAMPSWRDKVSDEDINALWAYVRGGP